MYSWDKYLTLIDALHHQYILLLNEMDIGMACSYNDHMAGDLHLNLE
jgi:hypothetical protein